jgi:hypothetical protein
MKLHYTACTSTVGACAYLVSVAALLACLYKQLSTLSVASNVRCKATFVTNIAGILAVLGLDDCLEGVVHLCSVVMHAV